MNLDINNVQWYWQRLERTTTSSPSKPLSYATAVFDYQGALCWRMMDPRFLDLAKIITTPIQCSKYIFAQTRLTRHAKLKSILKHLHSHKELAQSHSLFHRFHSPCFHRCTVQLQFNSKHRLRDSGRCEEFHVNYLQPG